MRATITNEEALRIYDGLREELETEFLGKFVKINVETRQYAIGDTMYDAIMAYRKRFGEAESCSTKIGDHTIARRGTEGELHASRGASR
jgi:hypothetical protein